MKKTMAGLSVAIVLLTVGSVILPALVTAADAGWFGLINLTPTISTVSPTGVQSGGPDFTLTLTGANFVSSSVVRWNGADRTTTYVSPGRLTATILAADIAAVGTASVTVYNPTPGGGTANASVSINTKSNSTTTIVSDLPDPSQIGQLVTVVYTVTVSSGTPTGSVTVTDSASSATCSALVAVGHCALTLNVAGTRTLTATYSGDANFNGSSGNATHVVFGPEYFPFMFKQPTPTPTPTPTPMPIGNPVRNGGFESEGGPWLSAYCRWPNCTNESDWFGNDTRSNLAGTGASPHTGSWAAWLGGQPNIIMRMDQDAVTVPLGGSTFRYWLWIQSDESTCNMNDVDGAWVWFNGHQIDSYALCSGNSTSGWVKHDLDLSPYTGQTGWLTFYIRILGANSNWFIDDVQMGTLSGAQFVPYRR